MSNHVIGVLMIVGLLIVAALALGIDTVRREGWAPIAELVKATAFVLLVAAWALLFVTGMQLAFTGTVAL
jgi:nitroreductase